MPGAAPAAITLRGPALIFGGNFGNLEATRALLAQAKRLGIPPQNVVCTGDTVAYCADPLATVEMLRRAEVRVVMGNCEHAFGWNAEDGGCGYREGSPCENLALEWYRFGSRMLDQEARAWMRKLPRRLHLLIGGRRCAVIHGGVRRINRFIYASTSAAVKRDELLASGCDAVLAGHSGLPFSQVVDGRLWHNAGVIGMPANDGTPRTWYSTIEPAGGRLRIEFHPLEYDHAMAARKMHQLGLCEPYAKALGDGRWPSCEMLPEPERAAAGIPLAPAALEW